MAIRKNGFVGKWISWAFWFWHWIPFEEDGISMCPSYCKWKDQREISLCVAFWVMLSPPMAVIQKLVIGALLGVLFILFGIAWCVVGAFKKAGGAINPEPISVASEWVRSVKRKFCPIIKVVE